MRILAALSGVVLAMGGLVMGIGGTVWAQEEEAPLEEVEPVGPFIDPAVQRRVAEELVSLCGDYRCEDFRFAVRVPILPEDDQAALVERLNQAMLQEADRLFQSQPNLQRLILDGSVFRGTEAFTSLEIPIQTLVIPRHRWVVGRFGIEQDAFIYESMIPRLQAVLPPPVVEEEEAPPPEGGPPPLPPLPDDVPTPDPNPEVDPPAPPPEGDVTEREPITP